MKWDYSDNVLIFVNFDKIAFVERSLSILGLLYQQRADRLKPPRRRIFATWRFFDQFSINWIIFSGKQFVIKFKENFTFVTMIKFDRLLLEKCICKIEEITEN